ncbi:uncharacterized protein F5891DRAFT_1045759 [Suillus fuscotomentosus]|uniref:Uncharacterized protein n=1 Tax=Suillus fuscotomentosus TaxID=1912939 RepID=A0AAD4HIS4_9AGAM|nr:uncharacterized protein F5891DRAFT_1045759 [Suillus fuscotomentosus]KAG1898047.1 hypothetical protein F5891DRAFT_1045759 [Suillus fuscotomentosus]
MGSENDAQIGYGRRSASLSSSRESSPAAKRQKRSFTPNSDDGALVVPAQVESNADASSRDGTPAPLIRQAVGFSWQPSVLPIATVNTYQAVLPSNPNAIQFLPGQALPKKKKRRAKPEYSAQTSRFRLSQVPEPTPAHTPEPLTQPTLYTGGGPYSSMYRISNAASPSASITMSTPSVADGALPGEAHSSAVSSTIASGPRSPYHAVPGAYDNIGSSRSRAPGQIGGPITPAKNKQNKKSTGQRTAQGPGSLAQSSASSRQLQPPPSNMHYPRPGTHYRRDYEANLDSRSPSTSAASPQETARPTFSAQERSVAPPPSGGPVRPLRMLTLLIEDVRSGVPDHQLAEIKVVLRPGEDPDGGFWANAKEVCETLQAGPSRIDGPARVYTLRGKYRQFFMRVDADNVLEAESCNLGVSKDRALEVVVEAPVPKGQLPPPPRLPLELPQMSSSDSDNAVSPPRQQMSRQAMYSGVTRDTRIDLLSQSDYCPKKRKRPSQSHSLPQNKAPRSSVQKTPSPGCMPHRARQSRHGDQESSSSDGDGVREISPPIPGRHAETVDERDDAIANFIRSDIEGDKEWPRCMSIISHGGPKRVSDILWSLNYVENRVKEHEDRKTPSHWDGAPNSRVESRHVWRVLNLTPEWGEECRTILTLVGHYGKYGRRYQDPHVMNEIDSTAPPTEKTWKRFIKLLHSVDAQYLSSRLMENM